MEAALRAIADPRRRQILALVRANEMSAGEIASRFDVTWPAISQHLTVLKGAGLVSERRAGTRRLYRARPEGFEELVTFLEGFWDERLATLKREAEHDEAADAVRWMGVAASLDARPGGRDRVEVLPGDVVLGEFLEVSPPRRLVHTWGWETSSGSVPPGSTTVAFALVSNGEGTLLRVTPEG